MKQKNTISAFILLVTLYAFGQKTELNINENFLKSKVERQLKSLKLNDHIAGQNFPFLKNRNFPQNSNLKSALAIKQRLDSLITQGWDETNSQWDANNKFEYIYDTSINMTQSTNYNWDETSNHWVVSYKEEYTYDANGNMIQYISYSWVETINEWVTNIKYKYIYDANDNKTQFLEYYWNETISQWIAFNKSEYTYDANWNMTQELGYQWDEANSEWVANHKGEYTYDALGNMTQELNYYWDENSSQWLASDKFEFTYDVNSNMTQNLYYDWDQTNSQWLAIIKNEYTYDVYENMTQYLYSYWEETTNQWVDYYKEEYTYDNYGNMTQSINYNWDEISQWIIGYKNEFIYDNSYSFSDLILPYNINQSGESMYFKHMLTGILFYQWDDTMIEWVIHNQNMLYYSEQNVSAVCEIVETELNVYPNPFSKYVSFSFPANDNKTALELFDIQGRTIISKEIRNYEKVNLEGLKKGIYFYSLTINGKKLNGKLIKE